MPEETKVKHEESFQVMPEDAPFESGFNWNTLWAALFVGFVMIPGAIYLGLVNGQNIAGGAEWVTIILFIEIAKRSFVRLRTQEIIIIYWIAGGLVTAGSAGHALFGGPFGTKIWDQYLVSSPQAYGIREYIPDWLCPSIKSAGILDRTFWHSDWLTPIVLIVVGGILGRVCGLAMGYVMYVVTNDLQRLTFPMARVYAFGATALAETSAKKEGWRWQVFSIGSFIGAMFGLLYTVVPTLSGVFLTDTVTILPIPFIDFTPSIKAILPATALGLNTNLGELLAGFVLPFWIVVGTFVSSMLTTFIVNPLLFKYGILTSWAPGMTTIPTTVCNSIDFWMSFSIGKILVVAALGIWLAGKALTGRSLKGWGDEGATPTAPEKLPPGRGHCPVWLALLLWAVCTAGFIWITYLLVPDFPWWICALFGFIWSPLLSLITAMMIGITGQTGGVGIPYLREGSFILSGYKGAGIWFAPIPMSDFGGGAQMFKQLEMTRTKFVSVVYMNILTFFVILFCSFLFWTMVWRLGPIPSSAYPYVQKMWPFQATMQSIYIKCTIPDRVSLYDFEGEATEKWTGTAEMDRSPEHATRETNYCLKVKFPKGQKSSVQFREFLESDWTKWRWVQLDVFNAAASELPIRLRMVDAASGKWERDFALRPGKNTLGLQFRLPKKARENDEFEFRRQVPPREKDAHVHYVPLSEIKAGAGGLNLESIAAIEIEPVTAPPADSEIYLDNIGVIGDASAFFLRIINWRYILLGLGVGSVLYTLITTLGAPVLLFYGSVNGILSWPHHTILLFTGAMLGRYYFRPKFGEKRWAAYAPILLAGYACGSSLIGMTAVSIKLIATSISQIVF